MTESDIVKARGRIYAIAKSLTRDSELAEDIVQEVQLKLIRNPPVIRNAASVDAWLYMVVRNMSFSLISRRKKAPMLFVSELQEFQIPSSSINSVEQEDAVAGLIAKINALPEIYRAVLFEKHVKELSYSEMATKLGLSIKTLEVRLVRARKLLEKRLPYTFKRGRRRDCVVSTPSTIEA